MVFAADNFGGDGELMLKFKALAKLGEAWHTAARAEEALAQHAEQQGEGNIVATMLQLTAGAHSQLAVALQEGARDVSGEHARLKQAAQATVASLSGRIARGRLAVVRQNMVKVRERMAELDALVDAAGGYGWSTVVAPDAPWPQFLARWRTTIATMNPALFVEALNALRKDLARTCIT